MSVMVNNFGCQHYRRNVKLIVSCCPEVYYCRLCHDENENHTLKRTDIILVQCARCDTKQSVASQCSFCKTVFGKYVCLICKLFDNEDKKQFHCVQCGLCREGGKENYFHCEKCNLCLNVNIRNSHKCVENVSRTDCSICLLNLHESVMPLAVLQCGHLLHETCYQSLFDNQTKSCPICRTPFF